ncbi:MAG: hypothetical protein EB161_09455 [Nitrosopumilaceae archaeon]|nr:hypothetical protein [Nitrosopumilaceae archaeon]
MDLEGGGFDSRKKKRKIGWKFSAFFCFCGFQPDSIFCDTIDLLKREKFGISGFELGDDILMEKGWEGGENSILVTPEDHIELSKAILKLLNDNTMRDSLGQAGYKLVLEQCNSNKMAEKTLEIYKDILNR